MTKAWLMMAGGFLLFCAGFPAMLDWSRYWWCLAFYVIGFALLIVGRRQHDLLVAARPGQEPPTAVADPPPARRKRAGVLAWIGVAFAMLVGLAGLRVAEQGVLPEALDPGTPARATVVGCVPHGHEFRCDARWTVGGASRTGQLYPLEKWGGGWDKVYQDPPAVGSQLDVHVRGGRAYQPPNVALDICFIAGGLALIAAGGVLYWYLRRRYSRR
ncbi:hypothetical protein [Mycobacterium sp. 1081908.1]|uniref:hypothetical protein n=1 Tax=Mycobacterium sp. 1081908.1 TaxID=1834066 RepID=UPI0007FF4B50|nr:hypothetical protein [Mycobacterium sp. 1081908.1]OBK43428.1 hypothetical protein A5655_16845 [Mycobacterium sp. 1081908.1]